MPLIGSLNFGLQVSQSGLHPLNVFFVITRRPRCEVLPILSRTDQDGKCESTSIPARSPNLSSYAERWVRSVKEECLSRLILFGESSLRRALQQYMEHYHEERNHQGKDNRILFPSRPEARRNMGAVRCRERLGGLLKYYEREAA